MLKPIIFRQLLQTFGDFSLVTLLVWYTYLLQPVCLFKSARYCLTAKSKWAIIQTKLLLLHFILFTVKKATPVHWRTPGSVWQDLSKFSHLGYILKVLGNFWIGVFNIKQHCEPNLAKNYCIGQLFFVLNGQILKKTSSNRVALDSRSEILCLSLYNAYNAKKDLHLYRRRRRRTIPFFLFATLSCLCEKQLAFSVWGSLHTAHNNTSLRE